MDVRVWFLHNRLKLGLLYDTRLARDVRHEVMMLIDDLGCFKSILEEASAKYKKDETFRQWEKDIIDAVTAIEKAIDTHVIEGNSESHLGKKIWLPRFSGSTSTKPAQEVRFQREKTLKLVEDFRIKSKQFKVANAPGQSSAKQVIVGFEHEKAKLIGQLRSRINQLDVITIVGPPGIGKTTLAEMIFRDEVILNTFKTRAWVNAYEGFSIGNVLRQIMCCLNKTSIDDLKLKTYSDLKNEVRLLLNSPFLIVIDDVWSQEPEVWDELKIALPSTGKVLIISRLMRVASVASTVPPHTLSLLSEDDSWRLLKEQLKFKDATANKEVFPSDLEEEGRKIARQCKGLPLTIVVIGEQLAAVSFTKEAWERVSQRLNTMESYDELPYHLKACFLYLGVFPEDYEIPARKLIRMWLAEGFIQHEDGFSDEVTAERYLNELICRSLIQREKVGRDGKVKTCRIVNRLRDFCIAEGEEEKSLQHCIHDHEDISKLSSKIEEKPDVRTYVSFRKNEVKLTKAAASAIPSAYKLLRVFESKSFIFPVIPSSMNKLVHLRYITLSLDSVDSTLPRNFSKLCNLQTLIVHTKSDTLDVKAHIWEMTQLRHFETNASATLPTKSRKGKSTSETQLQTLGRVSPESLTEEVIRKICNVKKLSIRGKLALQPPESNDVSHNLEMLGRLEKLKVFNVNDASLSQGQLPKLHPAFRFPPSLKSLTLSKTCFAWEDMSILGRLPNLRILKLKEDAFKGATWESGDGEFLSLEFLQIERINLTDWKMSSEFPSLRQLELKECKNLKRVPVELAGSYGSCSRPTLEVLGLYHCEAAAASAMKVKQLILENARNTLRLSIFPSQDT